MEKHNVIEESRTPGLEKEAAGGDMFDDAKAYFGVDPAKPGGGESAGYLLDIRSGKIVEYISEES